MNNLIKKIKIYRYSKWLTGVMLSVSLTMLSSMGLMARAGYIPPEGSPPSGSSVSGGSRGGCDASSELPLTLLAPVQHVGQTTTTTPTLAWFISANAPYRLRLSLYQTNLDQLTELIYQEEHIKDMGGIDSLTIAPIEPSLEVGQRYVWQVAIACDPARASYNQSFATEFQIAPLSEDLATDLEMANTATERARVYATEGYWYDALREVLADSTNRIETSNRIVELLQALALLEIEGGDALQHGEHLDAIAAAIAHDKLDLVPTRSSVIEN